MCQKIAILFVVLAAGTLVFGCTPACDTSDEANPPTWYEAGTAVNGIYLSSSSHERLLAFPGGKRYDLVHHLGFEPLVVQLYWSFSQNGIGTDAQTKDSSSLTIAAGNSALIQLKNEEYIRVQNDSCVEYGLLAVAWGNPNPVDAGAPDEAGSD